MARSGRWRANLAGRPGCAETAWPLFFPSLLRRAQHERYGSGRQTVVTLVRRPIVGCDSRVLPLGPAAALGAHDSPLETESPPAAVQPHASLEPDEQACARRASQLALAIAADFEWLHPPARTRLRRADPNAETVGQWIDMLADASIDLIQDVQPGCALPVRVLDAAHAAQVVADGPGLSDDVSALQALQKTLSATPALLPRTLLLAASYCDENVRAEALCLWGDAAAASYLGTLLSAGRELPGAVEAALHLIALAGPAGAVPGSNARAQLALLLGGASRTPTLWPSLAGWCPIAWTRWTTPSS